MSDETSGMSDQTGPIEPASADTAEAPAPPPSQPAYAVQPAAQQRPHFADTVMGMRSVVATAVLCVLVGGLGGFALGHTTGNDDHRMMMRGPGMFQRGPFPYGPGGFGSGPGSGSGNGSGSGSNGYDPRFNGTPQRRFDGTPPANPSAPTTPSPSQGSGKSPG
ncbi:MAG: hypothetical protein QM747_09925 [Nocardioides sp.]